MQGETIRLNGREVQFEPGRTILELAKANGIHVPTLCWLQEADHGGVCGICSVEVKGSDELVRACVTPAEPGMEIRTNTPRVHAARKAVLERMITSGQHNCLVSGADDDQWSSFQMESMRRPWHEGICPSFGVCKLQELAIAYGVRAVGTKGAETQFPLDDDQPMIVRDFSRCIQCGRCVAACNTIQVNDAIPCDIDFRSGGPVPENWYPFVDYQKCVHCGQCVQACPVGALFERKSYGTDMLCDAKKVRTTCPYCGVGCQQWLHVKDERILRVTGVEGAQPNRGRLCVKGRYGYDFIYSEERLTSPLIRRDDGGFREASWDEALDLVATRFKQIIEEHGPDALGGVSCARSINEDSYNMQKLFRAVIGTNNIDHCARSCHAPTVAGLATSFGSGAMTNSFNEFDKAKMFFVIGSNMMEAHPVASTFVRNAVRKGAKLIVADPRRHALADFADLHVPIRVGTDVAFINGLMHVLIEENLYDKDFVSTCCVGFDELSAEVMNYPPERAAEICGIDADMIRDVARRMASVKPFMLCYTLGITEHTCGKNNVMSTANLQMMLGNMGMEFGGVNPLRGQNNVQGACDMGALPNVFPGYGKVTDPAAREKFQAFWGVPKLPDQLGLMIPQMLEELGGKIKGFYIFGENLANTEPDIRHVEHCLASAEFLVCQDIFQTETTRFAHVVLPGAAWSEDDGTFTNSERRVNRVRKVKEPPGMSRPNWWIFKRIAKRMGQRWESDGSREIWDNEVSVMAPNLCGVKYARIENNGLQWPCPSEDHPGTCVLHQNGKFTCGLGNLKGIKWTPPAEVPDDEYPFWLSTGRRLYHYHTRTQTGRCAGLNDLLGEETADISPEDARRLGIEHHEMVRVRSRRGEITVKAKVTDRVPPGLIWMAFHFREGCANWVCNPAFDPETWTAEYKACAIQVEKLSA